MAPGIPRKRGSSAVHSRCSPTHSARGPLSLASPSPVPALDSEQMHTTTPGTPICNQLR